MKRILFCLIIFVSGPTFCKAQSAMASTAQQFLSSLDDKQLVIALYPLGNAEFLNWNYVPLRDRKGIALNDLSADQKKKGFTLLQTSLSAEGYRKSRAIMELEKVLKVLENRPKDDWMRDTGNYRFIFFGNPSKDKVWSWRIEGHHISFTFSFKGNQCISGTPGFMGSNPGAYTDDQHQPQQILKEEDGLGFELVNALKKDQLSKAVISNEVPYEIITGNSRKASIEGAQGLSYADMSQSQQQLMIQLIRIYINRYTHLLSDQMMKEIAGAGLENLKFSWIGTQKKEPGKPYYYRIQGPTVIIEFDNTQNNANHIHTVLRDLKSDFGGDLLLEHYKAEH